MSKKIEELEKKLKSLKEALNKADAANVPSNKRPVNALGAGWFQDSGTGALHHSAHGIISTSRHPEGHFEIKHGGRPVGRAASPEEAGLKIKDYVKTLRSLDTGSHNVDPSTMKSEKDVEKSGYGPKGGGQYDVAANVERKARNIGDVAEGTGKNVNIKTYSTKPGQLSSKAQASLEAARAKKLSGPDKQYAPEEIAEYQRKKGQEVKKSVEWSEDEMAGKLSSVLPFNKPLKLQASDEELFGHLVVSQEQQASLEKNFQGKFTDFFAEVQKPLSELKKFASEEEEIAYWRSIGTPGANQDDGSSGY